MKEPTWAVIEAVRKLHPGLDVDTEMMEHETLQAIAEDGAWGAAQFKGGRAVRIVISDELPYCGVPDVLAHEIAHVVVGIEHGHDRVFKNAYRRIRRAAKKIMEHNNEPKKWATTYLKHQGASDERRTSVDKRVGVNPTRGAVVNRH